jgi:hypothetical protein
MCNIFVLHMMYIGIMMEKDKEYVHIISSVVAICKLDLMHLNALDDIVRPSAQHLL